MSGELDEKAIEIALGCYSEGGCSGLDERERREVVTDIISAYLAASPSMEMEVVAWQQMLGGERVNFVRQTDAQLALAAMRAERDAADNALIDKYRDPKTGHFNFPADVAAIIRRLDAAEAQVLRLTEENEALRRVLGNAEKALSAAERWIEAEFPNSEIELNGALSNVHAEVSNTAYDARSALKENAL